MGLLPGAKVCARLFLLPPNPRPSCPIPPPQQATWANEGLPSDPLSVENGAIVASTSRWPLLIDPQLQGVKWVKRREEANGLRIVQQSQPRYIDTVVHCVEQGLPLLIENCPEELDAVLDPVIQRKVGARVALRWRIYRGRSSACLSPSMRAAYHPPPGCQTRPRAHLAHRRRGSGV